MNCRTTSESSRGCWLLIQIVAVACILVLWPASSVKAQQNAYMDTVVVSTSSPTVTTNVNQTVTMFFSVTGGGSHNGTECQVTGGPTYSWSAQSGTVVPPNGQSTCYVTASFSQPGVYTVTASCTMAYTTNNCGNLSGTGSRSVTVTVQGATLTLDSVNFGGSRFAVQKDDGTYLSNGSGSQPSPDYGATGAHAKMCFGVGSGLSATATFKVTSIYGTPSATFSMSASGGGGSFTGTSSGVTVSGPVGSTVTVSISCSGNMGSTIDNGTLSANFSYVVSGGPSQSAGSSTNTLFVVLGQPGGGAVTETRVNRVTTDCKGKSSAADIVNAVWQSEISPLHYNPTSSSSPVWANLDGNTGFCYDIINCMVAAIAMTGAGSPGAIVYCYPQANGGAMSVDGQLGNDTRSCHPGDNGHSTDPEAPSGQHGKFSYTENLIGIDQGGYPNNYECCYYYNQTYYPGGNASSQTFTSAVDVEQHSIMKTRWQYVFSQDQNNTPTYITCSSPGPDPEHVWNP